jgi:hypothetical protein
MQRAPLMFMDLGDPKGKSYWVKPMGQGLGQEPLGQGLVESPHQGVRVLG